MDLLKIAHTPIVQVMPDHTVMEAIEASILSRVGAVGVVEDGCLVGIFTERDVMHKVIHARLDPGTTKVGSVMTTPAITIPSDMPPGQVLKLMLEKHIRHLPVSNENDTALGMVSIRNILQFLVMELSDDLHFLEDYMGLDATGLHGG